MLTRASICDTVSMRRRRGVLEDGWSAASNAVFTVMVVVW
jgi:hypothetical protein